MANLLSRKGSIWMAVATAVVLVGGAYYFSGHPLPSASFANAATTQELLKEYAAKDSDQDEMPDWEEALYCTDPNNAHSVRADLTDSQAIAQGLKTPCYAGQGVMATSTAEDIAGKIPTPAPAANSLTDQFAHLFFNNYMSTRGTTPPSAADMQSFVQNAVTSLMQTRIRTDAFTVSDIKTSGKGADAMRTYAAQAADAFVQHGPHTKYGEIAYFTDAVQKNSSDAIKNLNTRATGYTELAQALIRISVPEEVSNAHLALANALAQLGNTVADLAATQNDPIRGMLGLGSYPADSETFVAAFRSVGKAFSADTVSLSQGDSGYTFYYAATTMANSSALNTP